MKKVLLLVCFLVATLSVVSAFSFSKNVKVMTDKDVMTVIAKKTGCTVTATCPNGNSVTCTENNNDCRYCDGYVSGWLAGGGCGKGGGQE
jgi:hypothetical protein